MSTLKVNTLTDTAATKSVPIEDVVNGPARAWVNFNGTGTVAIREQYNVASITDNGAGNYTVTFTTALADTNYAITGTCFHASSMTIRNISSMNTTDFTVLTTNFSNLADATGVLVAVFR